MARRWPCLTGGSTWPGATRTRGSLRSSDQGGDAVHCREPPRTVAGACILGEQGRPRHAMGSAVHARPRAQRAYLEGHVRPVRTRARERHAGQRLQDSAQGITLMVSPDVQVCSELWKRQGCGSFLESSADGRRDDGRLPSRRADALMCIRPARCAAPSLSGCLKVSRRAGRLCGFFCGQLHFKMPHSRRTRFRWIVCGLHMRTILQVRSSAVSSLPSSQPRTRPIKLKDEVAERCRSNNS